MADQNPTDPAWPLWIEEHGRVFLLYSRQRTRCEDDARDVLQDALVECWRRSAGRVPDPALVYATIRRRAIDLGRATDRRHRREDHVAADAALWFEPDFTASDTHRVVEEAMRSLPDPLREVVTLKLWGDLTFPEIARIADAPVATVTSRYRYAIDRLRQSLGSRFS